MCDGVRVSHAGFPRRVKEKGELRREGRDKIGRDAWMGRWGTETSIDPPPPGWHKQLYSMGYHSFVRSFIHTAKLQLFYNN